MQLDVPLSFPSDIGKYTAPEVGPRSALSSHTAHRCSNTSLR